MKVTHLPLGTAPGARERGLFGSQPLCGGLRADPTDPDPRLLYKGLHNYCTTQYGTFRDRSGRFYNAQRMVETEMASGLIIAVEGEPEFHPEGRRGHVGMVWNRLEDGAWVTEHMAGAMTGHGPDKGGHASEPLRIVQRGDGAEWHEGDVMSVQGNLVGSAFQWFVPAPDGGLFFCCHPYRVSGTCLGEQVEGFFFNDNMYLPPGVTYGTSDFFGHAHVLLVIWGNEYEDGTLEVGQFGLGRDRFAFAVAANQEGTFLETTDVTGVMERKDDGFPSHISFCIDDEEWVWEPAPRADMLAFGDEYRGAEGRVRRAGERRASRVWMGYVETFRSRG
jgi:hypothetical protein